MLRKKKFSMVKLLILLVAFGILFEGALFGLVCWRARVPREPAPADCIIVLGAKVYKDGRMSLVLRERVDTALNAWRDGYAPAIIVCGAQGRDEPCAEAEAMGDYLRGQGVPEDRVIKDEGSFNTKANLTHALGIMAANGWQKALIVTSDYHVERALWLARDLGLDASGLAAPTPHTFRAYWWGRIRETISWVLYFFHQL